MNIQEYALNVGCFGTAYIARQNKKHPNAMCVSRKKLSHEEVIAFIHQYVKAWCENNETDTMVIPAGSNSVMEVKSLELNEKGEEV